MTQASAETLIARCLMDPQYLESLRATPEGPLEQRDLERLRLFGGFISKVQHNDLWDHFPVTRRFLRDYGLELLLFADYRASLFSTNGYKLPQPQKIRQFAKFLEERLVNQWSRRYPGLLEVLRHERYVWELSLETAAELKTNVAAAGDSLKWEAFLKLIPFFPNPFRIGCFDRDPIALAAIPDVSHSSRRRAFQIVLGYSKTPDGARRVLKLDGTSGAILNAVNGLRQVRTVIARARASGLGTAQPRQFRHFFEQAAQAGILAFKVQVTP
jgi:hypothetical protein